MKCMIGVNTLTSVEQPVYANHCQFWYHLGKNFPPPHGFALNSPRRMSIDRMRNMTAKIALEWEADYLMFIDDDIVIPIDSFPKMLAHDKDIVAGWTIIRGHPFFNMFFRFIDKEEKKLKQCQHWEQNEIVNNCIDVDAVGFSCALIKTSLLKKVPPPWFVTGPYNTEDIYFCIKAKEFVPNVSIVVDLSIKTAHALGTEYIDPDNLENYKTYFEKQFPEMIVHDPDDKVKDRGDDYLAKIKEEVNV